MNLKFIANLVSGMFRTEKPSLPAAPTAGLEKIGRFPVLKSLGRGTQGAVYLARDPDLERFVAIKLLNELPELHADPDGGWPQARNLAQLRHPNIVALYEFGKSGNLIYLVFEYLEGTTLHQELKAGGALPLSSAYSTIIQVTDAMAYAHAQGILHLDLSLNNIMRDRDDKPRIMDFDLSRRADSQTRTGLVAGTLPFMAPECFKGQPLDARTDVYALGHVFYALLKGSVWLLGGTQEEMIASACSKELDCDPLQRVDPSGHFTDVIRRATAKLPAQRYANAREMHDALIAAWKRSQPPAGDGDATHHGTVAFLLKRIEHRGDFPAISRSLAEINKMTSSEETASIARIAGVVLRDYALTNRLLKLANSTYYSRPLGKVSTVSDAIRILGFDQVRLTCIGLTCFGSFAGGGKSLRLREQSIASFIAGLVARHLAAEMNIKDTEEAFLCAMLFDLGKTLALYYFPEDFREIEGLVCRGAALEQATRSVLGITLPELGHAVGEIWGLPPIVLDCMSNNPAPDAPAAVNRMHCIVRFANALVSVDPDHMSSVEDIAASAACLRPELTLGTAQICALLNAAIEKFKTFASVLEVDPAKSSYIQRLERWVAIVGERLNAASDRSAEAPRTILPTESPPDT